MRGSKPNEAKIKIKRIIQDIREKDKGGIDMIVKVFKKEGKYWV